MKTTYMGLLASIGMLSVGATVYAVTPQGGFHPSIGPDAQPTVAGAASTDGDDTKPAGAGQDNPGQFTAQGALTIEGRVGQPKMLKNADGETFVSFEVTSSSDKEGVAPPVSLAVVVDKSGSMRGSRIANALAGAVAAVQNLHDGDSVAVVAFDTNPQIVVPLTQIQPGTRDSITNAIRGIQLGGDTCISCGIEQGLSELRKNHGDVERMILLSDGDTNSGVRDMPGFRSIGERAQTAGVGITTVGVDVDFNEKLMTAVATASNGRHYFVENDASLAQVFAEEAQTLGQSVATGASIDVDLAPGVDLVQVFDRNFTRSGSRVTVPLGSFTKGETKTVLLKVKVPRSSDDVAQLADAKLVYRELATSRDTTAGGKLGVLLVSDAKDAADLDPVVDDRVQRSITASTLREANNLFSLGKVDEARRKLQDQRASLGTASSQAARKAPSPVKAKAIGDDFAKQDKALDEAERGFASPPAASPSPAAPADPSRDRQQKTSTKRNEENSFNLGR